MEIYILKADVDGTMSSRDVPIGVAVTTEVEAKKYVEKGGVGYSHSYEKVTVFDNKDEALEFSLKDDRKFIQECLNNTKKMMDEL